MILKIFLAMHAKVGKKALVGFEPTIAFLQISSINNEEF